MEGELTREESEAVLANAVDIRPTENVHADPKLTESPPRKAGELSEAESAAILTIATDVRPDENVHPED